MDFTEKVNRSKKKSSKSNKC